MASQTFQPVKANNGYSYVQKVNPDGSYGFDFLGPNGQPITNTQYTQGTGQQEPQLGLSYQLANQFNNQNQGQVLGASTSASVPAPQPQTSTTSSNPFTSNSSYYLPPVTYLGQSYDQNDPAQAAALLAAKQSTLGGQRDQQISQIQRQLQESLDQAGLQQGQQLGTFNQNAADYGRSLANNIVDLGQGHDIGQINSQQQFAGLSPNAFQSGQATSQQYGNDQYEKGKNQLHQNQMETVGGDYLTNGTIDPNSTIGKQIAGLNQQYNMFTGDARNNAQLGIQNANNAYGTGMDQNLSNLQALYNYAGKQFNYQGDNSYNPNSLPNVDISQFTPYANSSQLANSPQSKQSNPATWTGSSNPFSGLLGYNPTGSQSNYLNAFLNPGASSPSMSAGF